LWFDKEAAEAAELYTTIFKDSKITNATTLRDTPSGDTEIISVDLMGQDFSLMSAGPPFKFTPAISFLVVLNKRDEVTAAWECLSEGGSALMELDTYPFSELFGWVQDKYNLSWQLMLVGDREVAQAITPTLMFVGERCGQAEEASNFYASVFHDAKIGDVLRYGADEEPETKGTIKHVGFTLEGQEFAAKDSAREHDFTFNEAISFVVNCKSQKEIDYYWEKLSAVPEAEQCGWLKDQFGVSWQIVPVDMETMMQEGDPLQLARVKQAVLPMKKFDLKVLRQAYEGE